MQASFDSSLFAYAGDFCGRYADDRGIEVAPLRSGDPGSGVTVSAFNRGAIGMIGYDPNGRIPERTVFLPEADLLKACRGIKTAERDIRIDGDDPSQLSARVTTYHKAHTTYKDFVLSVSGTPLPPYRLAISAALQRWGATPESSSTVGRYDISLLLSAIKAMVDDTDSLVISGYDGGPLRLQREDLQIVIVLMPQTAVPIPPVPDWLEAYATAGAS